VKKTGTLKVSVSANLGLERLVMHPNDGFDLGLLRVEHPLRLCLRLTIEDYLKGVADEGDPVSVALRNDCQNATLLVGSRLHDRLGRPRAPLFSTMEAGSSSGANPSDTPF
jgi:hypothetical protein